MNAKLTSLLRDMLENARLARQFLGDRSLEDLKADIGCIYQLSRAFEILGEAATQAAKEGGAEIKSLPWRDMIDMRNKLIHGYRTVRAEILYKTVAEDVPPLIAELERILNESPPHGR